MAVLSYTFATASAATGLSRKTLERAVKNGELKAKRSSKSEDGEPAGSYLILAAELQLWLDRLTDA